MEEKVYFTNSDGLKLCGILMSPRNKTSECIVLCHGITVDKDEGGVFTKLSRRLNESGFSVLRFDFRGHGESQGKSVDMTISGEIKDIKAAVNFLKNKGFKKLGMVSASFAGGATSYYISENPNTIKVLVLWNPSIDYKEYSKPTMPWKKKYWGEPAFKRVEKFGFTEVGSKKFKVGKRLIYELKNLKPWKELLKVQIPILFIHGDSDTYVSYKDSVKYSKLVKNGILVTMKGGEHGFHDKKENSDQADKATVDFLLKYL
ncbi:MAG: hypothetical protein A2953_01600 [Candidatus Levybacteria bacterium RIFCSPLOWO2_01_FULL_36_54]|nr:MAG: hypothetical protein A2953_01600 [Candidatus Levybacteria bacterium RIFCSPLOWO2_01_FULL_36_54]